MTSINTTIGIDVGGVKKGFHAVANKGRQYLGHLHSTDPEEIATWALAQQPTVIAIDAPCMFSAHGRSRKSERDLVENGIRCFYTPSRVLAAKSCFYDWVFNAERLYQTIGLPIYIGNKTNPPCVIETFPHAVQVSLWKNDSAFTPEGSKSSVRRKTLVQKADYDVSHLSKIDFIDAALCAVSADYFASHQFDAYGCTSEGFIILPKITLK